MEDTTRDDLRRLDELHQERTRLQREEEALASELAGSSVRGVRTAMARILEVTVEALRLRYGPVKSLSDAVHETTEK
jgi:hypothetical protein